MTDASFEKRLFRMYGLKQFARGDVFTGKFTKVWAKTEIEAANIMDGYMKPYDIRKISNELARRGKISVVNTL